MKLQLNEFDILKRQIESLARENATLQLRLSEREATLQALAAEVEKIPTPEATNDPTHPIG